ncbi:hypothetical protein Q5762_14410 [Streptomyces sp. P9(2023)]|uniref:hypothetical protein n=1 Tax=Streptomyces sp. P9(2023) TaxID=3064394 RepID=UPI0028F44FC8|nr:hypothetical protein [Streptomyces sp. P9(2023)]MDT9689509.1 hypothetical protein [Streptomyces sp. P9(2023)]
MIDDRPRWAQRMESERAARGWSPLDAARAMRAHSDHELPDERTLARSWRRWEAGTVEPRDHKALISAVFGTTTHAFFPMDHRRDGNIEVLDVSGMDTVEIVARLRASDIDEATLDALRITVEQALHGVRLHAWRPAVDRRQSMAQPRGQHAAPAAHTRTAP